MCAICSCFNTTTKSQTIITKRLRYLNSTTTTAILTSRQNSASKHLLTTNNYPQIIPKSRQNHSQSHLYHKQPTCNKIHPPTKISTPPYHFQIAQPQLPSISQQFPGKIVQNSTENSSQLQTVYLKINRISTQKQFTITTKSLTFPCKITLHKTTTITPPTTPKIKTT